MTNRARKAIGVLVFATTVSGCHAQPPTAPQREPAAPPPLSTLRVFIDASGFSTTDLRDAHEQIVQLNTAGELIWTADGTRLPGYIVQGNYIPAEKICKCAFEVRFGTRDGERRAYLTAEYGHFNPGTLIDLEVVNGALVMTQSTLYPPGSYTLSGVITELTPTGYAPIEGIYVERLVGDGWRLAMTDRTGLFQMPGLYNGTSTVSVGGQGYQTERREVPIQGDTRFDMQLVRR